MHTLHTRYFSYLSLLVLTLSLSCEKRNVNNSKNDRERWSLKGNVKSLSEISYSESGKYLTTISFREDGFVTEQASYNPDKSLIRKWVFHYGNDNLKNTLHCYVLNDSLSYISTYRYDNNHNVISIKTNKPDGSPGTQSVLLYDQQNHKVKESLLDAKSAIEQEAVFNYVNNVLIQETYYDAKENRKWKQINRYNDIGKIEETLFLSMQDSVLNKITFKYDSDERLIETRSFGLENNLESRRSYSYTETGDEKERITYSATGEIEETQTHQYRYDKYKNWIFKSTTINNQPKDIITRDIQYYD